jgi:hypothetical protein
MQCLREHGFLACCTGLYRSSKYPHFVETLVASGDAGHRLRGVRGWKAVGWLACADRYGTGVGQRPTRAGQLRYLEYFHHALRQPVPVRPVRITVVRLSSAPAANGAGSKFQPALRVSAEAGEVFRSGEIRLGKAEGENDDEDGGGGEGKGRTGDGGSGERHDVGCGGCFGWSRPAAWRQPAVSILAGR